MTVLTNAMQILKSDDDFGREETDHVFGEHFSRLLLEEQEEFTTRAEVGDQANVRLRLHNVATSALKREMCLTLRSIVSTPV